MVARDNLDRNSGSRNLRRWVTLRVRSGQVFTYALDDGLVLGVEFGSAGTSGALGLRERWDFGSAGTSGALGLRKVNSGS